MQVLQHRLEGRPEKTPELTNFTEYNDILFMFQPNEERKLAITESLETHYGVHNF